MMISTASLLDPSGDTYASHKGMKMLVAVDGSKAASKAFRAAMRTWKPEPQSDYLKVVHVADPTKTYLPYRLRPGYIVDDYSMQLFERVPHDAFDVEVIEKETAKDPETGVVTVIKDAKETVCELCNATMTHFLFLGYVGRKGPKTDPTVMGSTSDYSMRETAATVVLCKKDMDPDATSVKIAAIDGSEMSYAALRSAVALCKVGTDTIVVVHIADSDVAAEAEAKGAAASDSGPGSKEAIEKRAGDILASTGIDWKLQVIQKQGGVTIGEHLVDFMRKTAAAHFLCVGADGMKAFSEGKPAFGSVSDYVVKHCRDNVVVCSDPKWCTDS